MAKEAMIRARTEVALKGKVDKIFDKLGLSTSAAINLFYKQVAIQKGLPFDVSMPNAETRKAMKEAEKMKGKARYGNIEEAFDALDD